MALEPITRKEKIIAGQDLTPITRLEMFLKQFGGGGGGVATLHINVTAVNMETMEPTFTADKTPTEMEHAMLTGPVWCVVTFAAGIMGEEALSFGVPPTWYGGFPAFGGLAAVIHNDAGDNKTNYVIRAAPGERWILDVKQFGG